MSYTKVKPDKNQVFMFILVCRASTKNMLTWPLWGNGKTAVVLHAISAAHQKTCCMPHLAHTACSTLTMQFSIHSSLLFAQATHKTTSLSACKNKSWTILYCILWRYTRQPCAYHISKQCFKVAFVMPHTIDPLLIPKPRSNNQPIISHCLASFSPNCFFVSSSSFFSSLLFATVLCSPVFTSSPLHLSSSPLSLSLSSFSLLPVFSICFSSKLIQCSWKINK